MKRAGFQRCAGNNSTGELFEDVVAFIVVTAVSFAVGLLDEAPEIGVLPAGRFKVKDEVLDAEAQVVQ